MKAREIFLILIAFTLIFILFSIVTLTGIDSDNYLIKPSSQLGKDTESNGNHKNLNYSSIHNFEDAAHQSGSNTAGFGGLNRRINVRPDRAKMDTWSSRHDPNRSDIKKRLTPVRSNGRVYLENTTGIEACEEKNVDYKGNTEIIE